MDRLENQRATYDVLDDVDLSEIWFHVPKMYPMNSQIEVGQLKDVTNDEIMDVDAVQGGERCRNDVVRA